MNILLGNLSVEEIESRMGIEFPDDLREMMESTRQENVSKPVKKGKWHCFDIPFNLVCGDMEIATRIYNSIKDLQSDIKEPLKISLQK